MSAAISGMMTMAPRSPPQDDRSRRPNTLLVAHLDGGIDDIAEHAFIAWHRSSSSLQSSVAAQSGRL
jgi:hypothetical protein